MAKKIIAVIGRGKSGTRIPSHLLQASDIDMGKVRNRSGDKTPFPKMNELAAMAGPFVTYCGDYKWDFSRLVNEPIPSAAQDLAHAYLEDVLTIDKHAGWKFPETNLCYPWIVRMFPEVYYLHWVRHPSGLMHKFHKTNDIRNWGVEAPVIKDNLKTACISWLYQYQIVAQTPKPKNFLRVRFEDYVNSSDDTMKYIEQWLGLPLARGVVRGGMDTNFETPYNFLKPALEELGYA